MHIVKVNVVGSIIVSKENKLDHVRYIIRTTLNTGQNISTQRRYQAFHTLNSGLKQEYPGLYLPSLPSTSW